MLRNSSGIFSDTVKDIKSQIPDIHSSNGSIQERVTLLNRMVESIAAKSRYLLPENRNLYCMYMPFHETLAVAKV